MVEEIAYNFMIMIMFLTLMKQVFFLLSNCLTELWHCMAGKTAYGVKQSKEPAMLPSVANIVDPKILCH